MGYPSSIYTQTDVSGTTPLSSDDHAARHNAIGAEVVAIETAIGTNSGTSTLKNFLVGEFAVRQKGGTVQDTGFTVNNGTFGTNTIIGGTIGTALIGTSTITGGTIGTSLVGTSTIIGGTIGTALLGSNTIQGGTANALLLGTPTIIGGSIGVSGTTVALTIGAGLVPTAGSIADAAGGTLTANAQSSNVFFSVFGTAAGNRTIGTPLNPTAWQAVTFAFKASGSANGTLVWDSGAFTFSQDTGTPAIGTGTSWNQFGWRYNPVTSKWQFSGQSKNIV